MHKFSSLVYQDAHTGRQHLNGLTVGSTAMNIYIVSVNRIFDSEADIKILRKLYTELS
jgi:4-hydroxybenzoate polyprenyltransferase